MVSDVQTTFLNAALNTTGTGTFNGGFTYDLWGGQASLPTDVNGNVISIDPGRGRPAEVVIVVTTTVTGPGASLQFALSVSDDAAETVNVVQVQLDQVFTIASGLLAAGFIRRLAIPFQAKNQRFLGISQIITGAALTGGAIQATVVCDGIPSAPPVVL